MIKTIFLSTLIHLFFSNDFYIRLQVKDHDLPTHTQSIEILYSTKTPLKLGMDGYLSSTVVKELEESFIFGKNGEKYAITGKGYITLNFTPLCKDFIENEKDLVIKSKASQVYNFGHSSKDVKAYYPFVDDNRFFKQLRMAELKHHNEGLFDDFDRFPVLSLGVDVKVVDLNTGYKNNGIEIRVNRINSLVDEKSDKEQYDEIRSEYCTWLFTDSDKTRILI